MKFVEIMVERSNHRNLSLGLADQKRIGVVIQLIHKRFEEQLRRQLEVVRRSFFCSIPGTFASRCKRGLFRL